MLGHGLALAVLTAIPFAVGMVPAGASWFVAWGLDEVPQTIGWAVLAGLLTMPSLLRRVFGEPAIWLRFAVVQVIGLAVVATLWGTHLSGAIAITPVMTPELLSWNIVMVAVMLVTTTIVMLELVDLTWRIWRRLR